MSDRGDRAETPRDSVKPADEPSDVPTVVEADHAPSRLTQLTAIGLAVLAPLGVRGYGLALGLAGAVLVSYGTLRGARAVIDGGGVGLIAGLCVAALEGAATNTVLLATVLAVVAWDVGRYGIVVGEQLGRQATTTRIEVAHVCSSLAVGMLALLALSAVNAVVTGRAGVGLWLLLVGLIVLIVGLFVGDPRSPTDSGGPAGTDASAESLATQSSTGMFDD